jgi:hypothetical protein
MDYTPIIRNEHVSTLDEILVERGRVFDVGARSFFPFGLPITTLNLCVAFRLVPRS